MQCVGGTHHFLPSRATARPRNVVGGPWEWLVGEQRQIRAGFPDESLPSLPTLTLRSWRHGRRNDSHPGGTSMPGSGDDRQKLQMVNSGFLACAANHRPTRPSSNSGGNHQIGSFSHPCLSELKRSGQPFSLENMDAQPRHAGTAAGSPVGSQERDRRGGITAGLLRVGVVLLANLSKQYV